MTEADPPSSPPSGPPSGPHITKSAADRADRLAREAAALRENLRRRKAQGRAREAAQADGEETPGG